MHTISSNKFLTSKEQVKHCESKGIQFNDFSKTRAIKYLEENNNYFKLRAFRKNYPKEPSTGLYIHLDFADLVDLAIIDNRLRTILLEMAISIEHFSKVHLLKVIQENEPDGSRIVTDYIDQLSRGHKETLFADLNKNKKSLYCGNLCNKYFKDNDPYLKCPIPIWVFIEIISFGQYLHFYAFCAQRTNDSELYRRLYLMRVVKDLRNACAHNNCLINNLQSKLNRHHKSEVQTALSHLKIPKEFRKKHLRRAATYQIVTTLYTHQEIVPSAGVHDNISRKLQDLKVRFFRDRTYVHNDMIKSTFNFLSKLIDIWY